MRLHATWILGITCIVLSSIVLANDLPILGRWVFDYGSHPKGIWVISKTHISHNMPGCENLKYKIISHPILLQRKNAYAIEVDAPPDKCRNATQKNVIHYIEVSIRPSGDMIQVDNCPSYEDLELFLQRKNRYCSGTFFGHRKDN